MFKLPVTVVLLIREDTNQCCLSFVIFVFQLNKEKLHQRLLPAKNYAGVLSFLADS
jgi:hypothetical protein